MASVLIKLYEGSSDENYLKGACYHIQQGAEKYLKHKIEIEGKTYPRTYQLQSLVDKLTGGIDLIEGPILNNLEEISDWATQMRYTSSYFAATKLVKDIHEHIQGLIEQELKEVPNNRGSISRTSLFDNKR